MTATTFDPNNKSTTFALSGGNLVATSSGQGNVGDTRVLTGPTYFEITMTTLTGLPAIGIANRDYVMSTAATLGTTINGVGFRSNGQVLLNNTLLTTIQTYVATNVIQVAVNIQNRLIWFNVNNGNWNNNASNNPATGVGGIDYSGMFDHGVFAAVSCNLTGAVFTAKFTAAFAFTPPTGFISADSCQAFARKNFGGYLEPSTLGTIVAARAPGVGPGRCTAPSGAAFSPAGIITKVSGTVKEGAVLVSGKTVRVYDGNSGEKIGESTSDGSGAFAIPAQGRTQTDVVAKDPTSFQAEIYDRVTPV